MITKNTYLIDLPGISLRRNRALAVMPDNQHIYEITGWVLTLGPRMFTRMTRLYDWTEDRRIK